MWPGQGSGFDADPFSPAGTAQREWILTQRLGRSRLGKLVVWFILALIVAALLVPIILSAIH
jgi:hypothetical protein